MKVDLQITRTNMLVFVFEGRFSTFRDWFSISGSRIQTFQISNLRKLLTLPESWTEEVRELAPVVSNKYALMLRDQQ